MGRVEEIGAEYDNRLGLKVGDAVICNASAASIPLYIEDITAVNRAFNQIEANGYAIVHSLIPLVKTQEDVPLDMLMFVFDQSGTLYRLHELIGDKKRFLVVGNSMLTNLIYGYVIRRTAGKSAEITCLLDKRTGMRFTGRGIDRLISMVFNEMNYLDILRPMECMRQLDAESSFDLSINCAEIPGAETINILATKPGGTVMFANLINNLNIALYITESISKNLEVRGAEGYLEKYDQFDVDIVRELAPFLEDMTFTESAGGAGRRRGSALQQISHGNYVGRRLCLPQQGHVESARRHHESVPVRLQRDHIRRHRRRQGKGRQHDTEKQQPQNAGFCKDHAALDCADADRIGIFRLRKRAFTGANAAGKKGYFELANNGVIFLDEIGELPLEMQAKLLRVIQDGEFYRVEARCP